MKNDICSLRIVSKKTSFAFVYQKMRFDFVYSRLLISHSKCFLDINVFQTNVDAYNNINLLRNSYHIPTISESSAI